MEKILKVSISYSWDSDEHKKWVLKLAGYLIEQGGINVTLDQYDLTAGKNMMYFMESAIEKADKVLIILTPGYKEKANERVAGVGYEHSIISSELFDVQKDNNKFIPILRSGDRGKSSPVFIKSLAYHNMTEDDRFESDAFNLVKILNDEPLATKPQIGAKPDLSKNIDPILEQAVHLAKDIDIANKRMNFAKSNEATSKLLSELQVLYKDITNKSIEYKNQTALNIWSDYNEDRCIVNMLRIGLNIFYKFSYYNKLKENELLIKIWDKPLPIKDSYDFPPWEQPNVISTIAFKPTIADNLDILWVNNKLELRTHELNGFAYSTLFDFVRKNAISK